MKKPGLFIVALTFTFIFGIVSAQVKPAQNPIIFADVPDISIVRAGDSYYMSSTTFVEESLEEVLDLMKRSLPLTYKIENQYLNPDETFSKKKVIITLKPR